MAASKKQLDQIRAAITADPNNVWARKKGWSPVYTAHPNAEILIIGQAPGSRAQESGVPWNDASGKNLRTWMGVDDAVFYDERKIALVPMDFYFPGTGKSGDLPPRPGFAEKWHPDILAAMPNIQITLLIGQYAQKHYLGKAAARTLTETVENYRDYLPEYVPLVHPSPRNAIWQKKNPWFRESLVPELQKIARNILDS